MPGLTIAEKILSKHAGREVRADEIAICDLDLIMMHDANGPLAIREFEALGGAKVFDPEKIVVVFDHCSPSPNERISNIHKSLRNFVSEQGVRFYESGRGVCHQLLPESGLVKPGDLIVGTDSHTCTYGAMGALSTGLGATDIGIGLYSGKLWFKVPSTVRVVLKGIPPEGCDAKDVILAVIGVLGARGCVYQSVEFYGEYLERCTLSSHLTIANMVVEMGAKCGFTCHSGLGIQADADAQYAREVEIDISNLEPMLAKPHTVDNICTVREQVGVPIQQAVLGSCTNGRLQDLEAAADILRGKHIPFGVRLLVVPASETVLAEAAAKGILTDLIAAGATICTPGCGVCVGTLGGVPADGETVISSTNRNFKGRMGNNKAQIFLGSPETVAASALMGKITDPREFLK